MRDKSENQCVRCGRDLSGVEDPLCEGCKRALLGSGGAPAGGERVMKVRIAPILREALDSVQPAEDIDEALLRALKRHYPEEATGLLSAIGRIIEVEANQEKQDKSAVLARLATQTPGPEITLKTSGSSRAGEFGAAQFNASSSTVKQEFIRVGDKSYDSLEEVPPHIRRQIEEALAGKGKVRKTVISSSGGGGLKVRPARQTKSGCLSMLLGGWIVMVFKGLWK